MTNAVGVTLNHRANKQYILLELDHRDYTWRTLFNVHEAAMQCALGDISKRRYVKRETTFYDCL